MERHNYPYNYCMIIYIIMKSFVSFVLVKNTLEDI